MSESHNDERPPRSAAEWTTFAISVAIVLGLMVTILLEARETNQPARPVASIGTTERVGEAFHVTVKVENRGHLAAEQVQVLASLEIDGETTEGDQVVDFLAGQDEQELVFVFADDPEDGKLTAEVTGFTVP